MITHLHNTKPETILFGTNRKGRWVAFVNFDTRPITEDHKQNELEWESDGNRYMLNDFSVNSLLSVMEPELLLKASEDEIATIITAFNEQDNIDSWKAIRKAQITAYDSSDAVNQFFLGGKGMWLDKATRVGLVNSIQAEKAAGRTTSTLWYCGQQFQLPVDSALELLAQLELYALDCYNVTAQHMAKVDKLDDLEALKTFNIRADYPQILDLKMME